MGAVAVGGNPLAPLVLVVACYAYIQGVVQNIIAGLKDADHDASAGAKTTALRLGSRVVVSQQDHRRNDSPDAKGSRGMVLVTGTPLFVLLLVLKAAQVGLALMPWYMGWLHYGFWTFLLLLLLVVLQTLQLARVTGIQPFIRDDVKRRIGLHEMATYITAPVKLIPLLGPWMAAFLALFPVLWLGVFLLLQYGELMADV